MTTLEERVSRLEGAYDHLATKADVAEVHIKLEQMNAAIYRLESRIIKWMVGAVLAAAAIAVSLTLVLQRVLGG